MFLKITRSGPRQYLQLVEAFRDDAGKAKHRTLVTLGRLDQLTDSLDSVISGLLKVTGRPDFLNAPLPAIEFESARALGNVWALNELWESLGFGELRRVFRKTRHSIDVEVRIPTKLDSDSTGSWTRVPEQAGQSARSDAGFLGFTRVMSSGSSCWASA